MLSRIKERLYMIKVPLPKNPLKNLNAYVLIGQHRNLIIDTGFNADLCFEAIQAGINELGIQLADTDLFITHLHSDHTGLSKRLASKTSKIYMSHEDAEYIATYFTNDYFNHSRERFMRLGFNDAELNENLAQNPIIKYAPPLDTVYTRISDGQVIDLGGIQLTTCLTPGHTPGHMCLYWASEKLLFSGDHIIFDITPNITKWPGFENSLKHYLKSLERISNMDIQETLSAHRHPVGDCYSRIKSIIQHHHARLDEALQIIQENEGLNAYEIASKMTWSIKAKNWQDFPVVQKYFATGEAASHIDYLLAEKLITVSNDSGTERFYAK